MTNAAEVPLRITVADPPPGVVFALQRGRDGLLPPASASSAVIVFDFTVRLDGLTGAGNLRFLGGFTQGPPDGRFVYVNSGTLAGQSDSCFTRRAKVSLLGIGQELVESVLERHNARIEARLQGRASDGGPACASVPLLGSGWSVVG